MFLYYICIWFRNIYQGDVIPIKGYLKLINQEDDKKEGKHILFLNLMKAYLI